MIPFVQRRDRQTQVCVLSCMYTDVHVHADSATRRRPAAQAEGGEPALYSGLGHVHTPSPDTRPCVTHAILPYLTMTFKDFKEKFFVNKRKEKKKIHTLP